jgi:hypothetical protein
MNRAVCFPVPVAGRGSSLGGEVTGMCSFRPAIGWWVCWLVSENINDRFKNEREIVKPVSDRGQREFFLLVIIYVLCDTLIKRDDKLTNAMCAASSRLPLKADNIV